jgi:hypothetical protein
MKRQIQRAIEHGLQAGRYSERTRIAIAFFFVRQCFASGRLFRCADDEGGLRNSSRCGAERQRRRPLDVTGSQHFQPVSNSYGDIGDSYFGTR